MKYVVTYENAQLNIFTPLTTVRHLKTVFLETTLGDDIDFSISCYASSDPSQENYFLRLVSASRGGQESASFRHDIGEISAIPKE